MEIEELIKKYEQEKCNFSDIGWVSRVAARYAKTMPDSQARCLLHVLAEYANVEDTKIVVDRKALKQVLSALSGPPHLIRELQATRTPGIIGHDNPINILIEEFNNAS